MSRPFYLLCLTALLAGCTGSPKPVTSAPGPVVPALQTTNGLEGADRTRWHHLAEGSEVFPLSWLLALTNPDTNKPFLDNPERFGLLPDPDVGSDNPYGLPVGLTADFTRDLRFVGVRMIGVNCAACHVSELRRGGQPVVRLDGAPNLFDLELFYRELARATKATFSDPLKTWAFLRRLGKSPSTPGPSPLLAAPSHAKTALDTYEDLDALKRAGPLEKDLAERIEKLHKQELERPAADLRKGLKTANTADEPLRNQAERVRTGGLTKNAELPADARAAARAQVSKLIGPIDVGPTAAAAAKAPAPGSPWAAMDAAGRAGAIGDTLSHFVETIRLLKARAAFLLSLGTVNGGTAPGFGRVDAFGGARNIVFGQSLPLTAPISYPHLWNINETKWFHWDANTMSLLERNIGQALGLGAVLDPDTGDSTVNVGNLLDLETLARKIRPPAWPEAAFGAIDAAKRDAGRDLFVKRCQSCHQDLPAGGNTGDSRMALDDVGTDPLRATNFARPVNGKPFNEVVSDAMKKVARRAGGTVGDENEWRVTGEYANRPLVASWATAPYLHNNSVPTIYDLLLPDDKRPKKFAVGSREYDAEKLGYKTDGAGATFDFDTSQPGNSNSGHSGPKFGTDLSEDQRKELLEYLKSVR
ncbi:MAG TPA: hypothetical protein VFW33_12725 [Gemmataceae bacterium]|nr:hypothetical protein [Gemmataceae bacterium]